MNWGAIPALNMLRQRLEGYNPTCRITGYTIPTADRLDDDIELYIKAETTHPYLILKALFEPWLVGNALRVVELSVALDERQSCYILLRRIEPQQVTKANKKRK